MRFICFHFFQSEHNLNVLRKSWFFRLSHPGEYEVVKLPILEHCKNALAKWGDYTQN